MSALPLEMVEKIMLDAAISKASPTFDNNAEVYRDLAAVCRQWKDVLDGEQFRRQFLRLLISRR